MTAPPYPEFVPALSDGSRGWQCPAPTRRERSHGARPFRHPTPVRYVALACLSPPGRGLAVARDALLVCFCVTTYAIATVAGFGWLLVSMALASCEPRPRHARLAYLAAFGVILAYDGLPLTRRMLEWLGPG